MPRRTTPSPFASKVGTRIRELRVERGLSLAQLADASFLSKGHLSSVEHGLAAITIETVERIARGLDLPPLYLLTFPDEDGRSKIAEIIRELPAGEVNKLRRELSSRYKSKR